MAKPLQQGAPLTDEGLWARASECFALSAENTEPGYEIAGAMLLVAFELRRVSSRLDTLIASMPRPR